MQMSCKHKKRRKNFQRSRTLKFQLKLSQRHKVIVIQHVIFVLFDFRTTPCSLHTFSAFKRSKHENETQRSQQSRLLRK
jgi:hypothetical protein